MYVQSHISIVDKDGMAVAITSTVNLIFGSQVLDPVTGVLFNDEVGSSNRNIFFNLTFRKTHCRWTISLHRVYLTLLVSGLHHVGDTHSHPISPYE